MLTAALVLLSVLIAVLAALLAYAALQPPTFRVERSARMEVAPEVVFSNINDFRKWEAWSPWDKLDPNLARTYSGSAQGAGAVYGWAGTGKVGSGRMEIVEAQSPTSIKIKIDFTAPFAASNIIDFKLSRDGDWTTVSWAMSGPQPLLNRLMGLVFNMDKLVGGDFAKGLASLKQVSEGSGYTRLMR
jgi:Polyketide cyclase / dehydrase and lipid transport